MNRALPLTPELRLVFRAADPAATTDELSAVAGEVNDWARALTMAEMEGAIPSLWRAIYPRREALPREVAEFLRMRTMISDFRMSQLSQRAQETVRAFQAAGVPVLLLKGAAIGALTDPAFHSRPMGDVDLLVHRQDVERAVQALLEAGWSLTSDEVVVKLLQDQHHLPHFVRADLPGLRLELHTMILPPGHAFPLDEAMLWNNAMPAPAPFEGAQVPSPEHLVLHTSIHFAWQHRVHFGAWRTMRSLAAIVSRPDFSWERLEREARRVKAGTTVYWTLRMGEGCGGVAAGQPGVGGEFGVLLPAEFPDAEVEAMVLRVRGRWREAMRNGHFGDAVAIGARFFVRRDEGEVVDAQRQIDRQERTRVQFAQDEGAEFVRRQSRWGGEDRFGAGGLIAGAAHGLMPPSVFCAAH
jgi:hypothetical protein